MVLPRFMWSHLENLLSHLVNIIMLICGLLLLLSIPDTSLDSRANARVIHAICHAVTRSIISSTSQFFYSRVISLGCQYATSQWFVLLSPTWLPHMGRMYWSQNHMFRNIWLSPHIIGVLSSVIRIITSADGRTWFPLSSCRSHICLHWLIIRHNQIGEWFPEHS